MRYLILLIAIVSLSGCATFFGEDHYFQSVKDGEVTNYYRLRVRGSAWFSSARYVSGYYDERAVDLFFNEIKLAPTAKGQSTGKLFQENMLDPGSQEVIKPLTPGADHGAFVMVLSSNASAVTNAIGQFAANQVVADAITNIVNSDVIAELSGSEPSPMFTKDQAKATRDQIEELFNLVPSGISPGKEDTERAFLRILNTIGRAQGHSTPFTKLSEAEQWFQRSANP